MSKVIAQLGLPSVANVSAATPPSRDRAIDALRIFSLLVVVSGHALMLLVTFDGETLQLSNLLAYRWWLQACTWMLQVLPLFFFAGAAASVRGIRPTRLWGYWLMSHAQRLYRPVFYFLAFWLVVVWPLLRLTVPSQVADTIMALSVQLLWFLGVYVLVLACLPLLAHIGSVSQLWLTVALLYAGTAVVDGLRLTGAPAAVGLTNFVWVWLIPAAIGVGYTRNLVTPRVAMAGAVFIFCVDVALVTIGPYELSLVTIPGQRLSNMTPPSLLLAGHAIVLSLLAIRLAPTLNRWCRRPLLWWAVAIGNRGAMTLYLWHLPALMIVVAASHLLGHDRSSPSQPDFGQLVIGQMLTFYLLTGLAFLVLIRLENTPIPFWDGPIRTTGHARSIGTGIALVSAGCTTLLLARYGLSVTGILVLGVTLALLTTARLVCLPGR